MKTIAVLLLSLTLTAPALAIPLAGDYVFVTGDPNISGSFTSTGSAVSAWSFSSDILSRLNGTPPFNAHPSPFLTWDSQTDPVNGVLTNNTHEFVLSNAVEFGRSGNPFAEFGWNANPSIFSKRRFASIKPVVTPVIRPLYPTVSFTAMQAQSVPVPDMLWPTVIGMVGLAGFVARRRKHAA